jgi:hypothetical protein
MQPVAERVVYIQPRVENLNIQHTMCVKPYLTVKAFTCMNTYSKAECINGFKPSLVSMHLGLNRPFVLLKPDFELWDPCPFNDVPDCSQGQISDILWFGWGGQVMMSKSDQSFTFTQNVSLCFFLCSASPAQGSVCQSHDVTMSSQGVMSSRKASNHPGLKDNNLIFAMRPGPQINSPACL